MVQKNKVPVGRYVSKLGLRFTGVWYVNTFNASLISLTRKNGKNKSL